MPWRGEAADGRILVEQGFGDTLQFRRYAELAAARGLRVIIEAPRPLIRLMRGLLGVETVVAHRKALPPFDPHCPMMSLPLAYEHDIGDRSQRSTLLIRRSRLGGYGSPR